MRVDQALPIPPLEMRRLVGPTDPAMFDNPSGALVFPEIGADAYRSVLDFGCGCGRIARQLIQQRARPDRYVGIDLHPGMTRWCSQNLAPVAPGFDFLHHDVGNRGFNPGDKPSVAPFPAGDDEFTLVIAHSVFTHLVQEQAVHYLREVARVLRPDGVFYATWFFFDKRLYPMMQEFQNALYINHSDPTNAVIFDREWVRARVRENGLVIHTVKPPAVRGFQWVTLISPQTSGLPEAEFPTDQAPIRDGGMRAAATFRADLTGDETDP